MSFSISVERLIERWQRDGLIDAETASKLNADLEKRASVFSLGSVLATLGGLLLGAAVIMLVAANWQEMPRLMRISLIFVLIWASYLGGAWRQARGDKLFPPVCYIVGAASFGAGLALVGQMYHLSGDIHSAAIYWSVGVLISAFLLRAPVLAAFGAGVACFYLSTYVFDTSSYDDLTYRWVGPLLLAFGAAAALFTRSRDAAHLWAMFSIGWSLLIYAERESNTVLVLMLIVGIGLILADGFVHATMQRLTRFAHPLAAYGLLLALLSLVTLQLNQMFSYSSISAGLDRDIVYSIFILALAIGAIAVAGRNNGGLRSIAYAAFSIQVLYLAFETVGTMIGTSGFFLTAGILVLLLAAFVRRMENRFGRKSSVEVHP
ncbi:DUF2157 domain-containing protein [Brucella intermedia]|uniref:DUF2157 domain-containing protein n=1 Tax=Brucella TaxID=234 RepID=UPI0007C7A707|nr:DUF2157 domain-containing protein [Brucella intermedia]PJT26862.1 DUF2157 domain-containing protein [Ochrobactrum sp. 30A/1000/2015]PJT38282.1 DUF2157 domain-containing protein [Ochrobactrum sp. 27A/999/2015]PJT44301.1 DUF2157 domain-containing protein [Ochrobactrum sp. 23A/997/2015]KAB2714317.1 DUF2157 domain-containing protein [Brucella intermedia]MDL2203368.1 DUF2157 domain-containing protein [Brucella intermedia]